jgi:hypothetical protein
MMFHNAKIDQAQYFLSEPLATHASKTTWCKGEAAKTQNVNGYVTGLMQWSGVFPSQFPSAVETQRVSRSLWFLNSTLM